MEILICKIKGGVHDFLSIHLKATFKSSLLSVMALYTRRDEDKFCMNNLTLSSKFLSNDIFNFIFWCYIVRISHTKNTFVK